MSVTCPFCGHVGGLTERMLEHPCECGHTREDHFRGVGCTSYPCDCERFHIDADYLLEWRPTLRRATPAEREALEETGPGSALASTDHAGKEGT